jgi:hypothetical protein
LVDILDNVLMDEDNNPILEILETVEELLKNNTGFWSSPQLAQSLFNKLFMLIKCDRKEVRLKITKKDRKQILFFLTSSVPGVPSSRVHRKPLSSLHAQPPCNISHGYHNQEGGVP